MLFVWAMVMAAAPVQVVDGGLSLEQVREQISWHSPEINACLPKKASVRYRFSVLPNGRVTQLGFVSAQKAESPKITCVGTALEKFRFAATHDGGVVEWDFAAASFDAGVPSEAVSLPPEEIPDPWIDDASDCYDTVKPDVKREGLASFELVALSSGVVVSASASEVAPVFAATPLAACLENVALRWSLPPTGQARRLLAHFVFATTERRAKSFFVPSASPRTILSHQPSLAATGDGLDKDVIREEIRSNSPRVKACFEMGLQLDRKLGGKVKVAWTIGPDGSVIRAELDENTTDSEQLGACIVDVVRHMKFPRPTGGGNVNVTFPWILKAAGEE